MPGVSNTCTDDELRRRSNFLHQPAVCELADDDSGRFSIARLLRRDQTGARLVFPANVWVYGPGRVGDLTSAKSRMAAPTSRRGALRRDMEQADRYSGNSLRDGSTSRVLRSGVVSLTARVFRAALADRPALWPGPLDATMELVYIPDAARALVEVAVAPKRRECHIPSNGHADDPVYVCAAGLRSHGRQAESVRCAAMAIVHRWLVQCNRPGCRRYQPFVDQPYPSRQREIYGPLRRCTPDASRRRNRDDPRLAPGAPCIYACRRNPISTEFALASAHHCANSTGSKKSNGVDERSF